MYHHHSQPQGPPPFSNAPRPPQLSQNQHQNHPASGMMSQRMDFQFPAPAQLSNELQSTLTMHGTRDVDHRAVDSKDIPNQHQGQRSSCGISQQGSYRSNPVTFDSDSHSGQQQGVDWSNYPPQSKMFITPPTPPPHGGHMAQNPAQNPQSSHTGTRLPNWTGPAVKHLIPRSGGGDGQGQSLYTAESAGSILASFGLSNEDLEVLSHYPDDQLTPDTLPFILRDIQINKSGDQKNAAAAPASSFSRSIHKMSPSSSSSLARSHSPEVPSLLTVTQTAGKVIDYGHASRAKEETTSRETFKREQLSSEKRVKLYPSSSTPPKVAKIERQPVSLKHNNSDKHGDQDYRRADADHRRADADHRRMDADHRRMDTDHRRMDADHRRMDTDHRKSSRSPRREFPPPSKSRNLDRDYRRDGPKPRPSPKRRSEETLRRPVPSSDSKLHGGSKKLPTPAMISDFSSVTPKVYPHTCSLCHTQCDQEKAWVDHINTVNHISACRDLRNKFPDWKSDFPSRSGRYGSRALWDPRDHSPAHPRPRSYSPSKSPPPVTHRESPHPSRPYRRPFSPHHHPLYRHTSGGPLHIRGKRPHDCVTRSSGDESHHPPSAKVSRSSRQDPQPPSKGVVKPRSKLIKVSAAKAANLSAKASPTEKKKKGVTTASQQSAIWDRLVYLTGIPKDASEEEVTSLVGSFGKINNVILIPCSGEQSDEDEGQKASVCMVKAEDAQSLARSTELFIRQQKLAASTAKKPEGKVPAETFSSRNGTEGKGDIGLSDKSGVVLVSGLPEDEWSEADIEKLVQPFGTPSGTIIAKQIGKILVYLPDKDVAEEMVKVNNFLPIKFKNCELKMSHIKQFISLSTPVALYNCLMGSTDQLESSPQVGWSSLLVIQNVPHASNGASEVQKLVRRFGTVIRSLVLPNMVICEMATAATALSVYKRFQAFPCIIQNNPLVFSRKTDPKVSPQSKIIAAPQQPSEDKSQGCVTEREEKKNDVFKGENENHPGEKATLSPTNTDAPPAEPATPEGPKTVSPEVEEVLSDDRGTRATSQSNSAAASTDGGHETAPQEERHVTATAEDSKEEEGEEEEEGLKTQEREQKVKDAREHRERERRERVQRERDRMERARRERDRREEKRRERDKVDRKSTKAVKWSRSQRACREEEQSSPSSDPRRTDSEDELDPFPFNMSDFVTVDEVGDVADLPLPPSPTAEADPPPEEDPPAPAQTVEAGVGDAAAASASEDSGSRTSEGERTPPGRVSPHDPEQTAEPLSHPPETENQAGVGPCAEAPPPVTAPPGESEGPWNSSGPGAEAQPKQEVSSLQDNGQVDPSGDATPAAESGNREASQSDDRGVKEADAAPPADDSDSLPPFNPHNPVGMEFLAPKTGFFCKVCNRFFSGAKEAEISHCKTLKHYDNLKIYLQTKKTGNASIS